MVETPGTDRPVAGLDDNLEEHAGQEQPDTAGVISDADKAVVQEVVDNFALVVSVESEQRRREDDVLEFEGVQIWSQTAKDNRAAHTDDTTEQEIQAQPTLEINLCEQRVQQVIAEARQARLGLSVQPRAGLANTKQSGYYKDLLRSIQSDSGAGEVRLWALERTAKCGRGAYKIDVDYNNEADDTATDPESFFDLDIMIRRILDQSTVYWDPYSVMADRSDAEWVILTDWLSEKERKRRWPHKPIIPPAGAFETGDDPWFAVDDKGNKSCRIVTYFKVIFTELTVAHHPTLGTMGPMKKEDLPEPIRTAIDRRHPSVRSRPVYRRQVKQFIVDGSQVLEQDPWLGRYLPVITVTGKEYNIKGKRSWKGLVENLMDLNRGYVVAISSAVEAAAAMPRAPYIMYAGQDAGFEEMWDDSPIKRYTRLYINRVDIDGNAAPYPERQNLEPAIQGALLLARTLKDDIGTVSGNIDPASRAVNPYDRSGKAIDLLQRQGQAGTSNFLDNLATISMPYEGKVIIDLIPKVYDRPGRLLSMMGEDHDDEKVVMLMTPFVRDKDGNPVPVPCQTCQGAGKVAGQRTIFNLFPAPLPCPACHGSKQATRENMPEVFEKQKVEYVDLTEGQFKVVPEIGRNFQTKQEEAMAAMSDLAKAAPPLVPVYADLWVRAMGFSGSTQIADRLKKMNPNAKDEGDQTPEVPAEFQQKFMELQQQHAEAMMQLQKATEALRTDEVKAQSAKELLAMKLEAAEGLENLKQQNKMMATELEAKADAGTAHMQAALETMRAESEQRHEVLLEILSAKHQIQRDKLKAETTLAAAEETAKTERAKLFLDERARVGVDSPGKVEE